MRTSRGRRRRPLGRCTIGALVLAFALPAAPARAADTVIGFDTLPGGQATTDGQAIKTQYQSQGVTFGVGPDGPSGITPHIKALPAGQAQSGTRALDIRQISGEFSQTDVWGAFDSGRTRVSVYVGLYSGGASTKIILDGYSLSGAKLASTSATVSGLGIHRKLEVTVPFFGFNPPRIAYFRVRPEDFIGGITPAVAIDDLAFPQLTGPPQPDFGLVWTNPVPGSDAVTLKKGESATAPIKINRGGGSNGPISFTVSGLPSGVHPSFDPNPSSGASTTLTLKADNNAPTTAKTDITVTGNPAPSAGSASRAIKIPLTVIGDYDLQVTGIEVTQNIQYIDANVHNFNPAPSLPTRDPAHPFDPVVYECCSFSIGADRNGVRLARGKPTTVRVFANVLSPADAQVSGAQVRLYGFELKSQGIGNPIGGDGPKPDESKPLPGSPLLPNQVPATLTAGSSWVTDADRTNPNADYRFTLPGSWMKSGGIALRAELEAPPAPLFGTDSLECEGQQCKLNNSFTLAGMTFSVMPKFSVTPVAASSPGYSGLPSTATAFQRWAELFPVPASKLTIPGYQGLIDVGDALKIAKRSDRDSELLDELDDWVDDHEDTAGSQAALVTSFSVSPGVSEAEDIVTPFVGGILIPYTTRSVVPFDSPTRNLPHELFHGYGQAHASSCGGGGSGTQKAVKWPPDQQGWIHGIGFSRSGAGNAGVIAPPSGVTGKTGGGTDGQWFDIMSYCASSGDAWLSTRNWNDAIEELRTYRKVLQGKAVDQGSAIEQFAQESAVQSGLSVNGYVASDGGIRLTRVRRGRLARAKPGEPSDLTLSVLDGAGAKLASATVRMRVSHGYGGDPIVMLEADAPLGGAARAAGARGAVGSVQIERGGQVVARLARSAHAPRVSVLAPRAGARVGRRRTVTVSWRATDADGGRLTAKVDYSLDGGRRWSTVATGLDGQRAALPSSLFAASRRARVRVRVNDGFNETAAVSGLFRAVGRPPIASIASPMARERLRADGVLFMSGGAVDDAGHAIGPRALRWYLDRRAVGRGNEVSRQGLPAGRHRVRLVAKDRLGRLATASRTILVAAVPPALVTLRVPARLSPRATRLALTVSSNVAAVLRIGKRRFATDRSPRRISVVVRPGRAPLTLTLKLTAGRQSTSRTVTVARG